MLSIRRYVPVVVLGLGLLGWPSAGFAGSTSPGCPGDVSPDGVVDVVDLLAVIGRWGDVADTHEVSAGGGFVFSPSTTNAKSGDSVHWSWLSDNHTATSGTGCTPDGVFFDAPLNMFSDEFTFPIPSDFVGQIPYLCQPHCFFGMTGVINVAPFWEDVTANGVVDVQDLLGVIGGWGPCK